MHRAVPAVPRPIVTGIACFLQIEPGPAVTAAAVRNREIVGAGQMDDYVGAAAAIITGFVRYNQDAAVTAATVANDARSALLADLLRRVTGCLSAGRPDNYPPVQYPRARDLAR